MEARKLEKMGEQAKLLQPPADLIATFEEFAKKYKSQDELEKILEKELKE